ncbi:MAG: YbaB/EbfC family nucleoid-associated protein [Pseudomonadota bacterium]
MKDIMGMMGKVKEMQARMEEMKASIEATEVEGQSGGGLVSVRLSGKGEMRGLNIDPTLLVPDDQEMLEDLILAAHNDAKSKAEAMLAEKSKEITAGLPIPPGMKLPF